MAEKTYLDVKIAQIDAQIKRQNALIKELEARKAGYEEQRPKRAAAPVTAQ